MAEEARVNLNFSQYRLGQRVQVDIHDPAVAGLVKAGYLKIIWKQPQGGASDELDSGGDTPGLGGLSHSGVDPGRTGPKKRQSKKVDAGGPGESGQGESVVDSPAGSDTASPDSD